MRLSLQHGGGERREARGGRGGRRDTCLLLYSTACAAPATLPWTARRCASRARRGHVPTASLARRGPTAARVPSLPSAPCAPVARVAPVPPVARGLLLAPGDARRTPPARSRGPAACSKPVWRV